MLLYELNPEQSKAFMRLVSEFVSVDNNVNKEEENVMNKYLQKLNLKKDDINEITLEDSFKLLKASEEKIKKMIFFELLSVALVDGEYETSEVDFLDKLSEEFKVSRATKIALANYIFDLDNTNDNEKAVLEEKLRKIIE